MINARGVIPDLQSSINIGGGEGDVIRIKLDLYLPPEDLTNLLQLRGKVIKIQMETED